MLRVRDGSLQRGSHILMDRLSFSVEEGELCILMGPSGLGKTTLLRALVGLADRSMVNLRGSITMGLPSEHLQSGYLAQGELLVPWLTVAKNIFLPFLLSPSTSPSVNEEERGELFAILELGHLLGQGGSTVSGGEAQRILLARTILSSRRVLVLDEPWSHLDAPLRRRMLGSLGVWFRKNSFTALIVSHDPEDAVLCSDSVLVMNRNGMPINQIAQVPEKSSFRAMVNDALYAPCEEGWTYDR